MNIEEREDEIIENEEIDNEEIVDEQEEDLEEPESGDDEVTERAKKYGHLSKEEWIAAGNDPAKYKTPEEFDKTGKVIEQIYSLRKKVDQRDREIQALIDYQQRTAQREYEKAKQELEARLANSKDDMDMEGVAHYSQELVKLQVNEQQSKTQQLQQAQHAAQTSFIERNQHWFNDRNPDLKNRAIEIDNELKGIYPNASYEELAQKIETRMQYEYPERVMGQTHNIRPNTSQSSVNKTATVKKHVFRNLSQEHKDTYNVYKRINPKITEADFIQKLKADGEIE
jgi:hypothetical protein